MSEKWECWTLERSELKQVAEEHQFDFNSFSEEQIEKIVKKFKDILYDSEVDWYKEWLRDAIKQVMT